MSHPLLEALSQQHLIPLYVGAINSTISVASLVLTLRALRHNERVQANPVRIELYKKRLETILSMMATVNRAEVAAVEYIAEKRPETIRRAKRSLKTLQRVTNSSLVVLSPELLRAINNYAAILEAVLRNGQESVDSRIEQIHAAGAKLTTACNSALEVEKMERWLSKLD